MPVVMKTPGVYIVEESAFPSSVVEVATAVPAFIGYTEKADNAGRPLSRRPWRISSLSEFHKYFGRAPHALYDLNAQSAAAEPAAESPSAVPPSPASEGQGEGTSTEPSTEGEAPAGSPSSAGEGAAGEGTSSREGAGGEASTASASATEGVQTAAASSEASLSFNGQGYNLMRTTSPYLLYYSMRLFFQNGGSACYVVSVGSYSDDIEMQPLLDGIGTLVKEQEPTMVVIPEAVRLPESDCISVQQAMLGHCGGKMKNRFAILDVYNGYRDRQHPDGDCIESFRSALGVNFLDFAAAYYPWLNTTIVQDADLSFDNLSDGARGVLQGLLRQELGLPEDGSVPEGRAGQQAQAVNDITKAWTQPGEDGGTPTAESIATAKGQLDKVLKTLSPQLYSSVLTEIKDQLNLLPAAAAMAGVYTMVDNTQGVWKAPANVSLNSVVSPSVQITNDDQEDLNVTVQGKSINAIRPFTGEGVLVWGGRTLDGNSLDWRYVQVRRTMIMLEESIRLAAKAYVFENNNANTWVTIKSTIRNFLTGIWKRGGLAGASPDDAFAVFVGLGETMTGEDILEGILRVTVLVAVTRPAEFIEITFQQQMQQS